MDGCLSVTVWCHAQVHLGRIFIELSTSAALSNVTDFSSGIGFSAREYDREPEQGFVGFRPAHWSDRPFPSPGTQSMSWYGGLQYRRVG